MVFLVMATQRPAAVDDKILPRAMNSHFKLISLRQQVSPTKSIKEMKVGGQSPKDFSDMIRLRRQNVLATIIRLVQLALKFVLG